MKKLIACLLSGLMMIGTLTACSNTTVTSKNNNNGKLRIVCTIFPEYDWVKQLIGDRAKNTDLTMLLDNGVDLHNYQPNADDIIKISTCDMFIYVGGESDAWVEDALKEATNKNMIVIDLIDVLGDTVKEEEIIEGMETEDAGSNKGEVKEEIEYDEHVWLSLKNTKTLCSYISSKLAQIDPANADSYAANYDAYAKKLDALDAQYREAVDSAKHKTILFGDRFPFRYLVDDYGLEYYAAFVGCSAETEASFETITFLAGKIDELELNNVLTIEGAQHKIAEAIIQNTKDKNQTVLILNSMQSTNSKDVANGVSYLSIMEENLSVLKDALN